MDNVKEGTRVNSAQSLCLMTDFVLWIGCSIFVFSQIASMKSTK